jgi:hypothetical protein
MKKTTRNKQQFIRTLKNYKLYTTFRLMVMRRDMSFHINTNDIVEFSIKNYFDNKSTKQIIQSLKTKQHIFKHIYQHYNNNIINNYLNAHW